jgi:hypothetical protein
MWRVRLVNTVVYVRMGVDMLTVAVPMQVKCPSADELSKRVGAECD